MTVDFPKPMFDVVPLDPINCTTLVLPFVIGYHIQLSTGVEPGILHDSLEKLVVKKWRVLGSRLGLDETGEISSLYIPKDSTTFNRDTFPAFKFTSKSHPVGTTTASRGILLPTNLISSSEITIHSGPAELSNGELFIPAEDGIEQYLSHPQSPELNPPIMWLHVVKFDDKTFLSIRLPHVFNDAHGFLFILKAWSKVFESGGVDNVQDLDIGWDPIAQYSASDAVGKLDDHGIPKGWTSLRGETLENLQKAVTDELTKEPLDRIKNIHIPPSQLSRLRSLAQSQSPISLKLSEGDVLMAWLCKTWVSSRPPSDSLLVNLSFPTDLRGRFSNLYKNDSPPYIHNGVFAIPVQRRFTISELQTISLGELAASIRQTVAELNEDSISYNLSWVLTHRSSHMPVPFTPPGITFVVSSFRRLDFVGTRIGEGVVERLWATVSGTPGKRRICSVEEGGEGGVWLCLNLPEGDFERGDLGEIKRGA